MDIKFSCEKCGQSLEIDESGAGSSIDCPNCGQPIYVPTKPADTALTPTAAVAESPTRATNAVRSETPAAYSAGRKQPQRISPDRVPAGTPVVITDIKIPFWRLVVLMIKWGIASIPAMIVLAAIFFFVSAFLSLLGLGLMMHGLR